MVMYRAILVSLSTHQMVWTLFALAIYPVTYNWPSNPAKIKLQILPINPLELVMWPLGRIAISQIMLQLKPTLTKIVAINSWVSGINQAANYVSTQKEPYASEIWTNGQDGSGKITRWTIVNFMVLY